jgi:hypothetical protein
MKARIDWLPGLRASPKQLFSKVEISGFKVPISLYKKSRI